MNADRKEVLALSIFIMLVSTYCVVNLSKQSASGSTSRNTTPQFSVTLIRNSNHFGPVNISVNDTVVATNIDANGKSKLIVPIAIPSALMNGIIRICATGITPLAPQVCTDVQNSKQGDKSVATLDMSKAVSG